MSVAPMISVLMPVRNNARTLRGAVQSILNQTYADFELIVLNDGSTDNTAAILSDIRDPRLRVVADGLPKGLATRLNEGVALAKGRYIARMDGDDFSFPDRFEKQVAFFEANPTIDLVATRALVFADDGQVIGLLPWRGGDHEALTAQRWRNIPMPHPSWTGRRDWFLANPYRLPEVMRAEDQELLLRALPDSRYACLPDILLAYRQMEFGFKKTLIARAHLLKAQLGLFVARAQYVNIVKAVALTTVKIAVDILAALPGGQAFFFARMKGEVVPVEAAQTFHKMFKEKL